jgi:hypothetical protein
MNYALKSKKKNIKTQVLLKICQNITEINLNYKAPYRNSLVEKLKIAIILS